MIEDQSSNNENGTDNSKYQIQQHELEESKSAKKSKTYAAGKIDKSTENISYINSNNEKNVDLKSDDKIVVGYENEIVQHSDNDNENIHKSVKVSHVKYKQRDNEVEKKYIQNNWFNILDSDSEDENLFNFKSKSNKSKANKIQDKESDYDRCNKSENHSINKSKPKKVLDNDTNNANKDFNNSDLEEVLNVSKVKSRFQSLIDSEIDEGERADNEDQSSPIKYDKRAKKHKQENFKTEKRKVSLRASKEEAMKQIKCETQRLIRESEVSLPYHKPRQRTLQEFLNRKKVITVLPQAPTMAAKLKMSCAIVDEALKEKEMEAETFYKSSDSEEEIEKTKEENKWVDGTEDSKKDKVARKLFVGINQATPEDEAAKNNSSVAEKVHDDSTGIKGTLNNERTENRIADSTTIKLSRESSKMDNRIESSNILRETDKNSGTDSCMGKDIGKENIPCDDNKHELEIINGLPSGTSNTTIEYSKMVKKSLGIGRDESDEYNEYGLPPPIFDKSSNTNERESSSNTNEKKSSSNTNEKKSSSNTNEKKSSSNANEKKSLLNMINLKPHLRGSPGTLIDISNYTKSDKEGISSLINRFILRHCTLNECTKDYQKVVSAQIKQTPTGLSIVKETLPYRLLTTNCDDPKWNKPGVKLLRLKEDLKEKMALKRNEEWKQREQDMKEHEIEWNESIIEEDDINVPFSPSIGSRKSEEDEFEEDDVCERKERKRKKRNAYIDDEAEVSEDGMSEDDEIEDDDEAEENSVREEESETTILFQGDEHSAGDDNGAPKCKTFERILKPSDDNSRYSTIESIANKDNIASFSNISDMFGKTDKQNVQSSDNENDIPVAQTDAENDLMQQTSLVAQRRNNNTFDFVSPLTQLTALNENLNDEESAIVENSLFDQILIRSTQAHELSQEIQNLKNEVNSHKSLFAGQDTNVQDDELMEIASGKFTEDKDGIRFSAERNVSESQLLELCSGAFISQINDKDEPDLLDDIPRSTQVSKERNSLDLDKDEQQSQKRSASWNKLFASSDEEDLAEEFSKKRLKKRIKKLDLSDDDDDNDDESNSGINSVDKDAWNYDTKYVDYDSEENEVVVAQKDIKKYAAKFLEEEAELSESDCEVSADEDEDDLDKLEFVDVDDEEIDEAQVKNQLGKLHVKQLLDEDQKEVRLLKELLFEDGDLHSESARERKFRWRNIDKLDDKNDPLPLDDDKDGLVDGSFDEDELSWRKMKCEREKFLSENARNIESDIESELNGSEVFKFGMKVLKKRRIDNSRKENTSVESLKPKVDLRIPHTIAEMLNDSRFGGQSPEINSVVQKRSFLAKGEESLARFATVARKKEAPVPLNARNFVFTYVDVATKNRSASTASND